MLLTTEALWEAFNGQLSAFILQRVSNPDDAEDILQEVFIKIHTHIDSLRDEDRLAPWVYRIARNTIYDYYRTRRSHLPLPESLQTPAERDEPQAIQQLAVGLRSMIDELPEKYRQALLLCELGDLTQRELAERLGLSLSGAKSRLQRGRRLLRQALLACCHFEFDLRGRVIDYYAHCDCCRQTTC
jgi:RNA polymerase sigma-70 factor (ECF subfamily)